MGSDKGGMEGVTKEGQRRTAQAQICRGTHLTAVYPALLQYDQYNAHKNGVGNSTAIVEARAIKMAMAKAITMTMASIADDNGNGNDDNMGKARQKSERASEQVAQF